MILHNCSTPTMTLKYSSELQTLRNQQKCKKTTKWCSFVSFIRVLEKYYVGELIDNKMPVYAVDK